MSESLRSFLFACAGKAHPSPYAWCWRPAEVPQCAAGGGPGTRRQKMSRVYEHAASGTACRPNIVAYGSDRSVEFQRLWLSGWSNEENEFSEQNQHLQDVCSGTLGLGLGCGRVKAK